MRATLAAIALALTPVTAPADPDALGLALSAVAAQDFALAAQAASRVEDPTARDVVTWARLRAREGSFPEYIEFIEQRGDWPGMELLRERGEQSIPEGADPAAVIAYFAPQAPRTGTGSLRLAEALAQQGDETAAQAEIIRAWTTMPLATTEFEAMLADYGPLLADHHIARLDNLLWAGDKNRARQMENFVPAGWRALAEARLALRERRTGVDALIEAVPGALAGDPGLAYERFLWRVTSGYWDTAADLLLTTSTSADALGRPAVWAGRRAAIARDVMRDGDYDSGYRIASSHHLAADGEYGDFAELEWLAGYAALRLGNAETAARHFQAFQTSVTSPISMGRAGYWLGCAYEAAGNDRAAADGYALGALFQSSFYGQLAAERGGLPTDPDFLAQEQYGDWRTAPFMGSSVLHAGLKLYEAGEEDLAERFLTHLTESLDRTGAGQLADLALDLGEPHIALMIAKRAAQAGHEIMRAYYPVTDLATADLPAPPALVLSIARRESEFDPDVVSPAGALGLMQVMPGTGRSEAARLGLSFDETRLQNDPAFNATIGASYLDLLSESFGTNPVLLAAAYNAGPSRARAWIERFGDPRDPEVDIIDWIEAIPFTETRNYIMRVTEGLPIYEAQLTGVLTEPRLSERLQQP